LHEGEAHFPEREKSSRSPIIADHTVTLSEKLVKVIPFSTELLYFVSALIDFST
jgi:hypothetical protein